jgi:hypothetical protein
MKQDPLLTTSIKVKPDNIALVTGCGPELLDRVLETCNYEASGDGVVFVDVAQLENTSDTSGMVGLLLEVIQKQVAERHQELGAELSENGKWHGYDGLIVLRA